MSHNLSQQQYNNVTFACGVMSAVFFVVGLGILSFTCGVSAPKDNSNNLTSVCKSGAIDYMIPAFASALLFAVMAVVNEKFELSEKMSEGFSNFKKSFFSSSTTTKTSAGELSHLLNDERNTPPLTV